MNSTDGPVILVVEDEDAIRRFLRISLEAHGFVILESRRAEDGLRLCAEHKPALIVLDLGLPDLEGHEFIQRLREWSEIPVIVLSVRAEEAEKVRALDGGANDYVTKPFGISELMARVRALLRNRVSLAQTAEAAVYEVDDLHVDLATREVTLQGEPLSLTRKEYELLRLLVTHAGQVLTHRQIIRAIWGSQKEDEIHHLRVLVGHLRQRLGDRPAQPRYIVTEQGVGYRFIDRRA